MTTRPRPQTQAELNREIYKRIRALEAVRPTAALPSSLNPGGTFPEAQLNTPGLWSLWPCTETSGDLVDVVGGRDLTPEISGTGAITYAVDGPFAGLPEIKAVHLAGSQGALNNGARFKRTLTAAEVLAVFANQHPFTFECLVYRTASQSAQRVCELGTVVTTLQSFFSDDLGFERNQTNAANAADASPLNAWIIAHGRYNGTTSDLFVNGVSVASTTDSGGITTGTQTFSLGGHTGPSYAPWHGRISHFAIYEVALSDATIAAHAGLVGASPFEDEWKVLTSPGGGGPYEPRFPTIATWVNGV